MSLSNLRNVKDPLIQQFENFQQQHSDAASEMDSKKRLILQSEAIDMLKELKDKMRDSLSVSTPRPYRNRARALFDSMDSFLKFNKRGELIDEGGKEIMQSRIEDLIQHAVRDRRRNITPTGWPSFLHLLKEHNVPRSLLNMHTLRELEDETTPRVSAEQPLKATQIKHSPSMKTLLPKSERPQAKAKRRSTSLDLPPQKRVTRGNKYMFDEKLLSAY